MLNFFYQIIVISLLGLIVQLMVMIKPICFSGGLQIPTSSVIGNIEFRDVSFTYPSREDALIFSGLNLNVPAGSVTAVVGPSGSGKSTIGSMLLRYYDPDKGTVCKENMSLCVTKPTIWVSDQVQHNPACTVTEYGWRLEILDLESRGSVLSM